LLVAVLATAAPAAETIDPRHPEASFAVNEALQREIYALDEDRAELLTTALAAAPEYAPARWHLGYIKDARRGWLKFDEYANVPKVAHLLKDYERERAAAPDTVAGQMAVADWCAENKLAAQERAHLTRVIELSPDHGAARRKLGFVREGSEWISRQDVAAEEARDQARLAALAEWRPKIQQLREGMEHRSQQKREFATAKLREITDAEAIAAIELVFRGAADETVAPAIETLAAMSDPQASMALARLAVYGTSSASRELAAQKLADRNLDTFVPQLLAEMYSPVMSRFLAISLPGGRIGYRHAFLREGDDEQQLLVLDTEYQRITRAGGNGRATAAQAMTQAAATARRREMAAAAQNRQTALLNERLAAVLSKTTGAQLPPVPDAWWSWWHERNEVFVQGSKPVKVVQTSSQVAVADPIPTGSGQQTLDCLAAGTPVWTAKGPVSIDQIRLGDLVLAQHAETGELAYKPVLRTTIRPHGKLIKIQAGGEAIETSGGHLFWVSGEGWTKSRELRSGQVLHTARGPLLVSTVEEGSQAQTYNLVVADFSSYFVGQAMILSHDNTVRQPTRTLVPGLPAR
jgi:hypothetical protein